jgi:hypothetical protein
MAERTEDHDPTGGGPGRGARVTVFLVGAVLVTWAFAAQAPGEVRGPVAVFGAAIAVLAALLPGVDGVVKLGPFQFRLRRRR